MARRMVASVPLKRLERPASLSLSTQEIIKDYIIANELRSGDALPPETELVRQLGVSRSAVREAVKGLAALGIIEVRRGSGLFVSNFAFEPLLGNLSYGVMFELKELADLLQIRRVLETGMVETAMHTMSDEQHRRLQQITERMRARAERGESFPEEDREFHRCLFEGVDNRTLLMLLDTFWLTFRKASRAMIENPDPMLTYRDHAAIAEAVISGDVGRARATLEQHYSSLMDRISRAKPAE